MRSKRMFATGAVIASLSVMATACAAPSADEGDSGSGSDNAQPTSLNLGWNQPFYSYNENTSNGNATANANIKYLMNDGFWYVDAEGNLQQNTSFGTYEATSEDPLVVKYTISDDAAWSDGTPVDAADMLLAWAAGSGALNTIDADKVKTDEATGAAKPPKDAVYFDTSSPGLALVTKTPEISDDNKSITFEYDKPFADWQYDMSVNVPAHITTEKALGTSDPQAAKDEFIKAVQDKDNAKLAKISQFWNTGYDYTKMPDDKDLALSSGAYLLTDFKENQYLTLKKNPDFKGEHKASIDQLTVRWNEDPLAQVQALENGELDMFSPQATTDVVKAAEKIPNVDIESGVEGTYEHIDTVLNNKGPFDPASYGGDEQKALKVRQAFLSAIPRQEIVDKLIKPINPDAQVRNSFLKTEGTPGYDEIVAQNGSSEYSEVDPARSKSLLEEAGVNGPIDVRVMYAADNVRRANEFQLMKPALAEAGFNLIDAKNADWGSKLGDGTYDAVFFGWQSTTPAVSADQATFGTGGINNLIGYSNKEVDKLFDQLILTSDETEQVKIQAEIEKLLFDDAIGITIFQFPSANISNSTRVTDLDPAILSPTMFYNFWNWKVPSAS
ncbi:peptide/nickel transport system substrate-binding protein [Nocardioides scoriae]|uniref:Peptide/nickel transport system substrate-binding protein n=1 Tax=Nocardioides scoriae TaxID=642780 RepID=A0A1H1N017_9ACTN|nr:ABC transporter family substrate-binding protein [Nocardioides scoriae]SDR92282.1 peptide/nickel transport system substrate-binding protein [Nocardioides scoriae]